MSPQASVIRSVRVGIYPKVDDDNPLALFHKKFLGKSMEDENAEWQKTQTQIGGQPEDEDQDQPEGEGKCKANEVTNEDEGKPDEDGTEATDEDDDILPGCHVLDISIPGITPKSLWIRADYIRIFDFFQDYYDKRAKPMDDAPSAVLTGQPSIGKSFWIYYATRPLLAERRPFIWLYKGTKYLFVDEGVYKLPHYWRDHDDFSCIVWTLVDSDQDRNGVPKTLVPHGTTLFVMYVTSPAAERWSRLAKTTQPTLVIMNPWGRREIQRAARLLQLEGITETHINEIFDQLGPVARLCIKWTSDQLTQYRIELHEAISKITADNIKKLTNDASRLTMDAVSHKIFLLRRQKRDEVLSRAVVAPITDYIKSTLSNQFRKLNPVEQIRLYQFFERVPESRRTAGIFFEAIAQSRLQKGMHLELVPMVKLEKEEGSKTLPQWHSSHMVMPNSLLEAARKQALGQQLSVDIRPKETLEYTDDGMQFVEPNILYVPSLTNQTAFGSFILLDGFLYMFQMTIASSRGINQGLIAIAKSYGFPPMDKWRFVFIIPPNLILSVPQPWGPNRSLSSFSVVVSVDGAASKRKRKSAVICADEAEASPKQRKSVRLMHQQEGYRL